MRSGTSLIEAQRMGRNSIGIELQPVVARESYDRIQTEYRDDCSVKVILGDSRTINMDQIIETIGLKKIQFVIMPPPYWDIIKFSDNKKDLSNAESL